MIEAGQGLTRITTEDLKRLLRALHHGDLRTPLAIDELTRFGLQDVAADLLALLRALDEKSIRAVLVAVLAERLGCETASSQAKKPDEEPTRSGMSNRND